MPIKEITDRKGRQFKWDVYDEHGFPAEIMEKIVPAGIEAKLNEVKQLELRDDDIMVCTFPKAGIYLNKCSLRTRPKTVKTYIKHI